MAAGRKDNLITFMTPQLADDGLGGGERTWVQHRQAWAMVKAVRASEAERQGQNRHVRVVMFTVYRDATITAQMRLDWNGGQFNIREIRDDGPRAADMVIIAESGVTQ